jgi:hypothetical protein
MPAILSHDVVTAVDHRPVRRSDDRVGTGVVGGKEGDLLAEASLGERGDQARRGVRFAARRPHDHSVSQRHRFEPVGIDGRMIACREHREDLSAANPQGRSSAGARV